MSKKVLILLANGCEELEAVTLIDLLRRAAVQVVTAGIDEQTVIASHGTRLIADVLLDDVIEEDFDIVILPGGMPGTDNLNADPLVHDVVMRCYDSGRAIAAICAAPQILAQAGLLNNKRITCYPGALEATDWPKIELSNNPVEVDGRIITGRSPGTAVEFAFAIIAYLTNQENLDMVSSQLVLAD